MHIPTPKPGMPHVPARHTPTPPFCPHPQAQDEGPGWAALTWRCQGCRPWGSEGAQGVPAPLRLPL